MARERRGAARTLEPEILLVDEEAIS